MPDYSSLLEDAGIYSPFDMGLICCLQSLSDIQMPPNLPVSMRMHNQGYTSSTLTTDTLRDMDLTYWGEGPANSVNVGPGQRRASGTRRLSGNRPHRLPALKESKTFFGFEQKSSTKMPGRASVC